MIECEAFLGGTKCVPKEKLIFRPGAYAVIVHEGKIVLLTNRHSGRFALPGGALESGERLADTLKREVREEAGIAIKVGPFICFREGFFYHDLLDRAFQVLAFYYVCYPASLDLNDNAQVDDDEGQPRWIEISSLTEQDIEGAFDGFLEFLKDCHEL